MILLLLSWSGELLSPSAIALYTLQAHTCISKHLRRVINLHVCILSLHNNLLFSYVCSEREPTANISTAIGNCELDTMATTYNFHVINSMTMLGMCRFCWQNYCNNTLQEGKSKRQNTGITVTNLSIICLTSYSSYA